MRALKRTFQFLQDSSVIIDDPLILTSMSRALETLRDEAGAVHIQLQHLWERHRKTRRTTNDAGRALAALQSASILKKSLSWLEGELDTPRDSTIDDSRVRCNSRSADELPIQTYLQAIMYFQFSETEEILELQEVVIELNFGDWRRELNRSAVAFCQTMEEAVESSIYVARTLCQARRSLPRAWPELKSATDIKSRLAKMLTSLYSRLKHLKRVVDSDGNSSTGE